MTTLLVGTVTIDTGVTINVASTAVKWPSIVTGTLNSAVGGPVKAIPFGTALTATQLKLAEPTLVASIVGVDGYALAYIDRCQYPLATKNGRRTWTIAGAYFTDGGAQGGAGGGANSSVKTRRPEELRRGVCTRVHAAVRALVVV